MRCSFCAVYLPRCPVDPISENTLLVQRNRVATRLGYTRQHFACMESTANFVTSEHLLEQDYGHTVLGRRYLPDDFVVALPF